MPLQGNFRDFNTTQVLNLISLSKRTGTLTIFEYAHVGGRPALGERTASVAFRNGKLIHASMKGRTDGLAWVLAEAGKLTMEQVRVIYERARHKTDKALALLLINANYVTQKDVILSIKRHNLDILYQLMMSDTGLFRFEDDILPGSDRIFVPVDLTSVIVEGSRYLQEEKALLEYLPTLDLTLRFPDRVRQRYRDAQLSKDEWRVVSFVSPQHTIRQIARANNMSDTRIRRIIHGLENAGLVEVQRPVGVARSDDRWATSSLMIEPPQVEKQVVKRLIDRLRSFTTRPKPAYPQV